jgi:hypothetical protein
MRRTLLAVTLLIATPLASAEGALLIEAERAGEPFRLVVDSEGGRALLTTTHGRSLVDLHERAIYVQEPGTTSRRVRIEAAAASAGVGYRVTPWGPGPVLEGHATTYHVIARGEAICAEMMVADWMREQIGAAVEAMTLLEEAAGSRASACTEIPFAVYAAAGWPMLAGKIDHLTFETTAIRFDYAPLPGELARPVSYTDAGPNQVVIEAFAPRR